MDIASKMSTKTGWLLLTLLVAIVGCGGGEPFDYVKVSGKVTYDDGSLIRAGRIVVVFLSQAEGKSPTIQPRPGAAEVDVKTGTFDFVTSHKYGDGIVPGKHKVLIRSIDEQMRPTSAIPIEYSSVDKTPVLVDSRDAPFHFQIPKPH